MVLCCTHFHLSRSEFDIEVSVVIIESKGQEKVRNLSRNLLVDMSCLGLCALILLIVFYSLLCVYEVLSAASAALLI